MGGNRRFGTVAAACTLGLLLGGASVVALAASGDSTQIAQSAEQTAQNYFYAGFEALQQNRLQEAVSMFEGGLQYSPNNAVATYYLALSYDRMASFERAAQLYQRAATLAPGSEEGRNAQERLRTMSATVPSARLYAEAPPEPASRSIREVFEQSAAGQASRQPEPQRNVQLPPPPVGRAVPPALPSRQAAAPQVSVPPYVAAPPVAAAPARRLEAPAARPAPAPVAPAADAASRFSMFDAGGGGTGRVGSRVGVERQPMETEAASASSTLPLPQPASDGTGATGSRLRMPPASATAPEAMPSSGGSPESPESSDIIWSTGGGPATGTSAAEAPSSAMPAPDAAPAMSAPSPAMSAMATPALRPSEATEAQARPMQPLGNLVAELPQRSSTSDLNARALQFVAARDGVGAGTTPSMRPAPAETAPMPGASEEASGRSKGASAASDLNQKFLDGLAASSGTAPAPSGNAPSTIAPSTDAPSTAGSSTDGAAMSTTPAGASRDAMPTSETSPGTIDLRSASRAAPEGGSSSMPPGPRRTETAARPSRAPTAAPERPAPAEADAKTEASAMPRPAASSSVAGAASLPKGSTTARLNALMLGSMSAPARTSALTPPQSGGPAPERASPAGRMGSVPATAEPSQAPMGTTDTAVVWDKEPTSAATAESIPPAAPDASATAGTRTDSAGADSASTAAVAPGAQGTMPAPPTPPTVPERPASASSPGMSQSLNEQSLAAISPKPEGAGETAATVPNLREEMRSRGGMVAALPLPKNPESLTLDDGTVYYGDLREKLPHGTGRLVYKDGSIYVGSFENGQRSGHGVLEMSGGWRYEGEFANNRYDGLGEMSWPDGATYVGAFSAGERTGRGVYWWPNGAKYEGSFVAGEPDGVGTYFYPDGRAETGTWKKGELVSAS